MLKRKRAEKRKQKAPSKPRNAASIKARAVAKLIVENPGMGLGPAMIAVGYAPLTAKTPSNLTNSKAWNDLLDEYLPRSDVLETHKGLLKASNLDHQTFPLETPALTDAHIIEMFTELNCKVRRIVHGEQARHVYFWAADNRARKDGLEMAYKLRGDYAPEKHLHGHFSLLKLGTSVDAPLLEAPSQVPRIEDVEA